MIGLVFTYLLTFLVKMKDFQVLIVILTEIPVRVVTRVSATPLISSTPLGCHLPLTKNYYNAVRAKMKKAVPNLSITIPAI